MREPLIFHKTSLASHWAILAIREGVPNERKIDSFILEAWTLWEERNSFVLTAELELLIYAALESHMGVTDAMVFTAAMSRCYPETNSCDITAWQLETAALIPFCTRVLSLLLIPSFAHRWQWPFTFSLQWGRSTCPYVFLSLILLKDLGQDCGAVLLTEFCTPRNGHTLLTLLQEPFYSRAQQTCSCKTTNTS